MQPHQTLARAACRHVTETVLSTPGSSLSRRPGSLLVGRRKAVQAVPLLSPLAIAIASWWVRPNPWGCSPEAGAFMLAWRPFGNGAMG
jgi:hypothetical protein